MSEEEKKAIEDLRKTINYYDERFKANEKITSVLIDNFDVDNLYILLNLIEKQNNRLEQLEKENEELKHWKSEQGCSIQEVYELFIPKSVIREKLKIARKHKQKADNTIKLYTLKQAYGFREDVFEELLGEEK